MFTNLTYLSFDSFNESLSIIKMHVKIENSLKNKLVKLVNMIQD